MDGLPISYTSYDLSDFVNGILKLVWTSQLLVGISELCVLDARLIKTQNIQINKDFHLFGQASYL